MINNSINKYNSTNLSTIEYDYNIEANNMLTPVLATIHSFAASVFSLIIPGRMVLRLWPRLRDGP